MIKEIREPFITKVSWQSVLHKLDHKILHKKILDCHVQKCIFSKTVHNTASFCTVECLPVTHLKKHLIAAIY